MEEITYVTDEETLRRISSNATQKEILFLKFFLVKMRDKLVVHQDCLAKLIKEIHTWDHLSSSLKDHATAKLMGIAKEYRDNNTDEDPRDGTIKIVERNFATVRCLIVLDPPKYKTKIKQFNDAHILTPEKFMYKIEASGAHSELMHEFNIHWEQFIKKA